MSSKLIPMEEAAKLLGMSVDRLTELRSNNEIFGYRDGSNWKFKFSELERVAGELGINFQAEESGIDLSGELGFDLSPSSKEMLVDDEASSSEMESVEYMEDSSVELFQKPLTEEVVQEGDSIELDDEGISLVDSGRLSGISKEDDILDSGEMLLDGSSLKLGGSDVLGSSEDVLGDGEEALSFGSSSLRLASESSKKIDQGTDSDVLDEPVDKAKSPSDTGKMLGEDGDEDDLLMSEDDLFSDELSLADSSSFEDSAELSSDFDDSDLVLDDSDSSTEITLEANESGINLSANESGIALADEPLELGGSDIDALELPEDDDMIVLESANDQSLRQEDDFNLTPLEESMEEDDSSGSQVIALEDSEIYADDTGQILGESEEFEAQPALLDDTMGGDFGDGYGMGDGAMMMPGAAMAGVAGPPEAPYSMWQVISLGIVASLLLAGSMIAYNLAQNLWMPEDQIIGSSVLNFFLKLTGMN